MGLYSLILSRILPVVSNLIWQQVPKTNLYLLKPIFLINCDGANTIRPFKKTYNRWLKYRIQGHSFPYHWITQAANNISDFKCYWCYCSTNATEWFLRASPASSWSLQFLPINKFNKINWHQFKWKGGCHKEAVKWQWEEKADIPQRGKNTPWDQD